MIQRSIRQLSTGVGGDLWFRALQASLKDKEQTKVIDALKATIQQGNRRHSNPLTEIIRFWAAEQPKKEALWTHDQQTNASVKLTFDQIYVHSSRLGNVLAGKDFQLVPGKSVGSCHGSLLIQIVSLRLSRCWSFYPTTRKNASYCK